MLARVFDFGIKPHFLRLVWPRIVNLAQTVLIIEKPATAICLFLVQGVPLSSIARLL